MLGGEIGENRHIVIYALVTPLLHTLGGYLEHRVLAAFFYHFAQEFLGHKAPGHGHVVFVHPLLLAEPDIGRADKAARQAVGIQNRPDKIGRGGFAFGAGDADYNQFI